jgi:nucleotide-binding universal stress UspA family protein
VYKLRALLCPTDFSEESLHAIRYAAFAASSYDGIVTLLHVDTFEKTPMGHFQHVPGGSEQHRSAVEAFCQERFAMLSGAAHLTPESTRRLIRFGTSYREIIDEAESGQYSAVVISTQGLGLSSPHLIGRTAERIVRLCRTPVLTIRPKKDPLPARIKTILCPTDFSEYGNYAIPYAISIARTFEAAVIFLHISDLSVSAPEKLLEKFPDPSVYHDRAADIRWEKLVGRDVEPENTIERVVEEREIDLIVMGTHGARGLRRVQIGNTTEEVIRRVTVPVLAVTHPIHRTVFPRRFSEDYDATGGDDDQSPTARPESLP